MNDKKEAQEKIKKSPKAKRKSKRDQTDYGGVKV